jgi:hypothetical protein
MLPQVNYLVAPGARLAVGSLDTCLTCNFEEGGSSKMAEMLMQVRQKGYLCARVGLRGGHSLMSSLLCLGDVKVLLACLLSSGQPCGAIIVIAAHVPGATPYHVVQGLAAGASKEVKEKLDL